MMYILLLVIIIFVSDILFDIRGFYNINNNTGSLVLCIWKIPILSNNIEIKQNILIIKKKRKSIKINLKLSKKQIEILKELSKNISAKTIVDYMDFDLLLCMENAYLCSILSGLINIFSTIFISRFQLTHSDTKIYRNINTGFRQDMITIRFKTGVYISIADIIWSIIITIFTTRRLYGEKRRKMQY